MVGHNSKRQGRLMMQGALGLSMAALLAAVPMNAAMAQQQTHDQAPQAEPMSAATSAMVNLISLLIKQGTLTPEKGMELLRQAQGEAERARGNIEQAASNAGVAPPAPPPPPPAGVVRVPYVPETVRRQIAEQVRSEIMSQAKAEGWAAPDNAAPDWTRKITISGDVRVRSQSNLFSKLNDNQLLDYAAINATAGGFDFFNDQSNAPFVNTTQDRVNRLRLRARLGIDADINKYVSAGIRIGTGDDASPISTNENLGGGLSKRDIWLDRAFVELRPIEGVNMKFGRFANPFWNTSLLFDDDLNFDGVAATVSAGNLLSDNLRLSLTGGAFPLDFGNADYPETSQSKGSYASKWLLSGQFRADYRMDSGIEIKFGAAYHHFRNVQGRLSAPCIFSAIGRPLQLNDPDECSTDGTRAFSPRKGNTYFFIRQLTDTQLTPMDPVDNPLLLSAREYLGLVQRFHVLDLNASVAFPVSDTVKAELHGEFIKNMAFDSARNCRYGELYDPQTNVVVTALGNDNACTTVDPARVASGDYGWLAGIKVGHTDPRKWGQWSFAANYRYLQTDATLDSLSDSDFHLGGTNTKGYTVEGTLGLLPGTSLTARWMSANEITGAPLSIDVLQIDLSAEF